MEVEKEESKILYKALTEWEKEGVLPTDLAEKLRETVQIRQQNRQQIAQYFFFIALCSSLLAFGAIFLSEKLLEKLKAYFAWGDLAIAILAAVLSGLWFWYTARRRAGTRSAAFEIYMALGGLSVLTSLLYFCKYIHADTTYYTTFLSLSVISLGVLSTIMTSRILWLGTLFSGIFWFGAFSTVFHQQYLFLGMNYPVRYVVFGAVVLGFALAQNYIPRLQFSQRITYVIGLSLFFVALWSVSIFGNFNSLERWQMARQSQVLIYSGFLAGASALSFYLGVRFKDNAARDYGVLFLIINLYTRYFEYFWDTMNKGIFFTVLAITFGLLGRWLERKSNAAIRN